MEEKKHIDLGEMLAQAVGTGPVPTPTEVRLAWDALPEVSRANIALRNMSDRGRLDFFVALLDHWRSAFYNASYRKRHLDELHKIFGDKNDHHIGDSLLYTLTADQRQFRCWYGIPGSMARHHVDSCGSGLVVSVYGEPDKVKEYVEAVLPESARKQAVLGPNGTVIYGFYGF